jgi:hypothetical protein
MRCMRRFSGRRTGTKDEKCGERVAGVSGDWREVRDEKRMIEEANEGQRLTRTGNDGKANDRKAKMTWASLFLVCRGQGCAGQRRDT